MLDRLFFDVLAGIFGLLIGSFLNVCIYRWPRDQSVVNPARSRCPECQQQIAAWDNIPILSYLILRGRCRHCKAPIHWRYPAVELLTGIIFAFLIHEQGLTPLAAKSCLFGSILIALAFSDADLRILPDELTLGGALAGFLIALFVPVPDSTFRFLANIAGFDLSPRLNSLGESLLGAIACSGTLWLAGWLFEKLRHKEGLGFGDVKMLVMIGAFLGVQGSLLTIITGSLLGSLIGLSYIKLSGKDASTYQLPFGSFLAIAAFLVATEGARVIGWYDQTLR